VCRVDVTGAGAGAGDDKRREGWNGVRRLREGECVVLVRDGGGEDDSDSDSGPENDVVDEDSDEESEEEDSITRRNARARRRGNALSNRNMKAGTGTGSEGVSRILALDDHLLWTASGSSSVRRWRVPRTRAVRWASAAARASSSAFDVSSDTGVDVESKLRFNPELKTGVQGQLPSPTQVPVPSAREAKERRRQRGESTTPSIVASFISSDADADSTNGFGDHINHADHTDPSGEETKDGIPYASLVHLSTPNDPPAYSSPVQLGLGLGSGGGGGLSRVTLNYNYGLALGQTQTQTQRGSGTAASSSLLAAAGLRDTHTHAHAHSSRRTSASIQPVRHANVNDTVETAGVGVGITPYEAFLCRDVAPDAVPLLASRHVWGRRARRRERERERGEGAGWEMDGDGPTTPTASPLTHAHTRSHIHSFQPHSHPHPHPIPSNSPTGVDASVFTQGESGGDGGPDLTLRGSSGLVRVLLLNDRIHALTVDTRGVVCVWDVVRCRALGSFGRYEVRRAICGDSGYSYGFSSNSSKNEGVGGVADDREQYPVEISPRQALELVRERVEGEAVVNGWCAAETRTGQLVVHMLERCFEAEVFGDEVGIGGGADGGEGEDQRSEFEDSGFVRFDVKTDVFFCVYVILKNCSLLRW
jgi:hypothetical protein